MDFIAAAVFSFVFLLTTKITATQKSNENGLFFDAFPGRKMTLSMYVKDVHHTIAHVSDKLECVFACMGFLWCVSANFNSTFQKDGLYECMLWSVDRFSNPGSFQEDKSITHLGILNPCTGKPCLNGGTCVVQYNRRDYTCACRQENSGDHCENLLYLNISIRSVGMEDVRPNTTCTESLIQVNNVQNCLAAGNRGHNIIVYNKFGVFQNKRSFDTHASSTSGQEMKKFLEELPNESIVLIAVWDDGSTYVSDAIPALQSVGATNPNTVTEYRSSWLLVGYKGGSPSWITEKREARAMGPSSANVIIPKPVVVS